MHMNIRIIRQECIDLFGLVRREIVGNDMNLFALGLVGDNVSQKCNKLSGSMALSRFTEDFTGLGIESI